MPAPAIHGARPEGRAMAKVTIHIPGVAWRDGRPRFSPGPKAGAKGEKGQDLRTARRRRPAPLYSVDDMLEQWQCSKPFTALAERSQASYAGFVRQLRKADADLVQRAAAALTRPICRALYERLWEERTLAMAVGIMRTLSAAYGWAILAGKVALENNPCSKLRMKTPAPRIRVASKAEMLALIAAADAEGLPEIGDAIVLGLWTGQRQADRLQLVDRGLVDGRRVFRQSKTGAVVMIPEAPELAARLAAARERRRELAVKVVDTTIIVSPATGRAFRPSDYTHKFGAVRAAAIAAGAAGLAGFQDRDLRDTAVTWLARGGCTVPEICAITGHEQASAVAILKHYLAIDAHLADAAIKKMVAWYEQQEAT